MKHQRRSVEKEAGRGEGNRPLTETELDRLVDEATIDCYNETEQVSGLYTMIEDNLVLPFETTLFGKTIVVERIDLTDRDDIVAICSGGREQRKMRLLDVPLPSPPPEGAQWIAAYRHWRREEGPL
ncbi:MAG: hypothetical protein ACKV2U_20630 [Bryobacteraceae bacterium]